jgi:hypothetical protein
VAATIFNKVKHIIMTFITILVRISKFSIVMTIRIKIPIKMTDTPGFDVQHNNTYNFDIEQNIKSDNQHDSKQV